MLAQSFFTGVAGTLHYIKGFSEFYSLGQSAQVGSVC